MPNAKAQTKRDTTKMITTNDGTLPRSGNSIYDRLGGLIGVTVSPPQMNSIHFGQSEGARFTITWKDNKLEILYGKETKPSEAVKQFFNWLEEYAKQNYYIIKKEDLDKVLGKCPM